MVVEMDVPVIFVIIFVRSMNDEDKGKITFMEFLPKVLYYPLDTL